MTESEQNDILRECGQAAESMKACASCAVEAFRLGDAVTGRSHISALEDYLSDLNGRLDQLDAASNPGKQ